MLYRLTTTLTPRQFTYVGYKKLLKTFTAPRANEFTIEYYDHNINRPNQDQFLDGDRFANPQLPENFFIKTSYVFTLTIFDRKYDHIISESHIRAFARNPNIDIQSIGIYSKSDIQHHIRTQQFQELLTQMDTIQRQSIDQNLRKLAETAGFADIFTQDYRGCFKDNKDYIYLNGDKYRPQDISPINIFSFVTLKNKILEITS